ncbi:MAG: T9SS type A sorting domain-containing protein [candidate division KSB1 bacterium]|nr:T9SS type A sorting domain-containing protein [candidate division KSB1 bacterium]
MKCWLRWSALLASALTISASAQNLIQNPGMESPEGWQVIYYNQDQQPGYEFNYRGETLKFGLGGNLHIFLDNSANGQLLLFQRVKCIAGETYRATAAIKVLNFAADYQPVGQGPWYQFYVTTEMPDPNAGDFNPGGAKMFDISAWDTGCDMLDFEQFQGLWEVVRCNSEIPTAPYWICPGNPGETVEVTVGIKFGVWGPGLASFELLVDEVGFYALGSNELMSGDCESEDGWEVIYYNVDGHPQYEFGYAPTVPFEYSLGKCLHITLDNVPNGQCLLYQRVTCIGGETYRATGVIKILEYVADFEPVGKGPWYQFYVTEIEPDPNAGDFNPGGTKMFDISAWDSGCDMLDFEQFQGIWEDVCCVNEIETAPYFIAPGAPGEPVEVTVGIKFGHWAPDPGYYEVLVDEVGFYRWTGSKAVGVQSRRPSLPGDFALDQNYPNPFNPSTTIGFSLPTAGHTILQLYNTNGELVKTLVDNVLSAGRHKVTFSAEGLPSGIYTYRLQQNGSAMTKKCIIVK